MYYGCMQLKKKFKKIYNKMKYFVFKIIKKNNFLSHVNEGIDIIIISAHILMFD